MIDHTRRCIFVHCQKCGGESVELAIKGVADKGYGGDAYEGSPQKHFSARQYISSYGQDTWDNYFTFSFVRNPWDRVISWIRYRDKRRNLYGGELTAQIIKRELSRPQMYKKTYAMLLGFDNKVHMDFVGRFEANRQDFDVICDMIGIPRQKVPHENKTAHRHYTEYYDDETREIVAHRFRRDIEYFGYEFGK